MLASNVYTVERNPNLILAAIRRERAANNLPGQQPSEMAMPAASAPHGYHYFTRSTCGHNQAIPVVCSDPLCWDCERLKAHERQERWLPVVKRMSSPRLITLTIPNGFDPKERLLFLQASFRKLLELRLGLDNLGVLCDRAIIFAEKHYQELASKGEISEVDALTKITAHTNSIRIFHSWVINFKRMTGHWPKMRKAVGPGFASLETTWNDLNGYHFHRHLCTDGRFIPWAFLCVAWAKVTGDQASITDIRSIDKSPSSMQELCKYVTKGWEIPPDQRETLRAALRGVKRIWPLGGAKPEKPVKVCPYCGDPLCHAKMGGSCYLVDAGELAGNKYQVFEVENKNSTSGPYCFVVIHWQEGGTSEGPLLDTLSDCAPPMAPPATG